MSQECYLFLFHIVFYAGYAWSIENFLNKYLDRPKHAGKIFALLLFLKGRVQTFLTTPGLNDITQQLIKEPKIFHIDDGQISENSEMAENHIDWVSEDENKVVTFYPKNEKSKKGQST